MAEIAGFESVSVTNTSFKPVSMLATEEVIGSDTGLNWQRHDTKYLPAASLDTVTVDAAGGNSRLRRCMSKGVLFFAMYISRHGI